MFCFYIIGYIVVVVVVVVRIYIYIRKKTLKQSFSLLEILEIRSKPGG